MSNLINYLFCKRKIDDVDQEQINENNNEIDENNNKIKKLKQEIEETNKKITELEEIKKLEEKEENIEEKKSIIRKITYETYITQLLNSDIEFIHLYNSNIPILNYEILTQPNDLKNYVKIIFESCVFNTINKVLTTENLTELIFGEIVITNDFITDIIVNLIYDQYESNNFFINNFPKLNLELIKPCYYDSKLFDVSCRLGFDKFFQFFFNNYCNQKSIDILQSEYDHKYLSYSYNIKTSEFNFISSYQPHYNDVNPQHIGNPFIISFTKGIICFELLNHGYIYRLIEESKRNNNRFTFFPLSYIILGKTGHACFVVFDNVYNSMSLLDPNGTTDYLTKYITGNNDVNQDNVSLPYILDAFNNYINIFNQWNTTPDVKCDYKFHYELQNNISLNTINQYSYNYDVGHCQTLILFIIHILYMHQDMFTDNIMLDLNTIFTNLDHRTLTRIKYNFSANLMRIIIDNQIIKLEN